MQTAPRPIKLKFESAAVTHVGRVRKANEDSFISRPDLGLWAVADGVGGHEAGQFASQTITEFLETIGPAVNQADQIARFEERVLMANDRILTHAAELDGAVMGSTIAAFLVHQGQYACVWSGDSRVYQLRNGELSQLSHDHSEVQELIDNGTLTQAEAKTWPRRNVITRAVGIFEDPGLEVGTGEIIPGDVYLVCSDGLTGHVSDLEIAGQLSGQKAEQSCEALLSMALERGGTDNVSVIVIRCHRAESTKFIPGSKATGAQAQL